MTDKNRRTGLVLALAIALLFTLGWGLKPFQAAGGLECKGPLQGSAPKERATRGFVFGREESVCNRSGGSRLIIAILGGVILAAVGVSAVLLPESRIERVVFGGEDPEELY
ncbi:MAG: hypothetical protein CYG61_04875 [Actinobacteria bacterium]|nr:MAG: hypothetical protein CYG61_04875 [Actinomycetota bacterium]